MTEKRRAVFLDRDGVLNVTNVQSGKPYAPRQLDDFVLLPDVVQSTAKLQELGFLLVVVTNQPDVGNNLVERETIEAMHARLTDLIAVDIIKVCYHSQNEGCLCRKPRPGMLIDAIQELNIDPTGSFLVGDRSSDIEAGLAVGCTTLFIDNGYAEPLTVTPNMHVKSLLEATHCIQAHIQREHK